MSGVGKHLKKNLVEEGAGKWSVEVISRFLEIYQNYEVLWNINHSDYANKNIRDSALLHFRDDLTSSNIEIPDLVYSRSKIKNIKSTYRQELQNVLESRSSGAGTDDLYEPKLVWFYDADAFLRDVTVTRSSISNLESERKRKMNSCLEERQNSVVAIETPSASFYPEVHVSSETINEENEVFSMEHHESTTANKKRRYGKLSRVENSIATLKNICESRSSRPSEKRAPDEYDSLCST